MLKPGPEGRAGHEERGAHVWGRVNRETEGVLGAPTIRPQCTKAESLAQESLHLSALRRGWAMLTVSLCFGCESWI